MDDGLLMVVTPDRRSVDHWECLHCGSWFFALAVPCPLNDLDARATAQRAFIEHECAASGRGHRVAASNEARTATATAPS